jgi:hypothetical protein
MEVTPAPIPPRPEVIYSLNKPLLERMCEDIGWENKDTGDNNIAVIFSKDDALGGTFFFQSGINLDKDIFALVSFVSPFPMVMQSKWPRALVFCNEYNQKDVVGRGCLDIKEGQNEATLAFLSFTSFQGGVTETFLQNFIVRNKKEAHEFFRQAHTEWKLY